jgi:hypothetical protein
MTQVSRAQIEQGMKEAHIERAIAFQTGIKAVRTAIRLNVQKIGTKFTTAISSNQHQQA